MFQRVREFREKIAAGSKGPEAKDAGDSKLSRLVSSKGDAERAPPERQNTGGRAGEALSSYREGSKDSFTRRAEPGKPTVTVTAGATTAPSSSASTAAAAAGASMAPRAPGGGRARRNSTPAEMDLQMMKQNLERAKSRLLRKDSMTEESDNHDDGTGRAKPVVRDRFAGASKPRTASARPGEGDDHRPAADAATPPSTSNKDKLRRDEVPEPSPAFRMPETPKVTPARQVLYTAAQLPVGMARSHWSLDDYNILAKMYKGYASSVYQAVCKKSLEPVALKVYHMENLVELNVYQVFREIRVHSKLGHSNIIALHGVFQEGTDIVLVMEYAQGGDLYKLLHRCGGHLAERQAVQMVLSPFLHALHYMHTQGILHRDIKPENVLFTDDRVLKLADFGLAIDLNEERAVTRAGTLDYMAPEVLKCPPKNAPHENKEAPEFYYSNSVDAWAVGVFAYELIVGYPPFASHSQSEAIKKIMTMSVEFPEKVTDLAKDFIGQCLARHPGDRPTVVAMLSHPWIAAFQRRRSTITMPAAAGFRRNSSFTNAGGAGGTAFPDDGAGDADGGVDPAQVADEYTPEEIEQMIHKLKLAKEAAEIRRESDSFSK